MIDSRGDTKKGSSAGLIERYWQTANSRDWQAFAALQHDDMLYSLSQTRERVQGKAGYTDFNATFPGDWQVEIARVIAEGEQGVSLTTFRVSGQAQPCITFFDFKYGLIYSITDFRREPYDPPQRTSRFVERD